MTFTLGSTLHTVHGRLELDHGWITVDPETGAVSGEVVLDARSASTDNDKRDKKMHTEVLMSERFRTIVFAPTSLEGSIPENGSAETRLTGEVQLLGVRHPVTLEVNLTRRGGSVDATGSLTIPYVAWGLEDPSVFILRADKQVVVNLDVHGTLRP